jgi:hypothetical protein
VADQIDDPPPFLRHPRTVPRPGRNTRSDDLTSTKSLGHVRSFAVHDAHMSMLREVVADRTNPAWDHIDREAVEGWIEHYPNVSSGARMELMGAAVAAIWLRGNG